MTKSDTMEAIMRLNETAKPEFLVEFSVEELGDYLHQLEQVSAPRRHGRACGQALDDDPVNASGEPHRA